MRSTTRKNHRLYAKAIKTGFIETMTLHYCEPKIKKSPLSNDAITPISP